MTVDERIGAPPREGVLGDSVTRPDGIAKTQGTFSFSSDESVDGCLFGATLRSPHPYARIVSIDLGPAWRIDGVHAVITADDVPGQLTYGLIAHDQPVFASDYVRYVGEPIAAVAADVRPAKVIDEKKDDIRSSHFRRERSCKEADQQADKYRLSLASHRRAIPSC